MLPTTFMISSALAAETAHSDDGLIALSGALVLLVGWVIGGVVMFHRSRRRRSERTLPPAS